MNNGTSVKLALVCAGAMAFAGCICADTAKIGALVLDEVTENPVKDVRITGLFPMNYGRRAVNGLSGSNYQDGVTDSRGRCKVSGKTNVGRASFHVEMVPSGYYRPFYGGGYDYKSKNVFGVWQPDNLVVTIRLQRVENPIPLFVKQIGQVGPRSSAKNRFPTNGENASIAFDLMKGEWLPPLGKGDVADIVFERLPKKSYGMVESASGALVESWRHSLSAVFPGAGNGVVPVGVGSAVGLKIRTAPENGYDSRWTCWRERNRQLEEICSYDENRCFCFRIRTKRNEKGEVVSAHYGKIYGDISFASQAQPEVVIVAAPCMRYYLNQMPLDRNLEWNMVNLCKNPGRLSNPQP